jgi:hypothetical protein
MGWDKKRLVNRVKPIGPEIDCVWMCQCAKAEGYKEESAISRNGTEGKAQRQEEFACAYVHGWFMRDLLLEVLRGWSNGCAGVTCEV